MTLPIVSSCDDCGACCMHMVVPPFVAIGLPLTDKSGDPLWDALPLERKQEIRDFYESGTADVTPDEHPCLWLDLQTRRCRHYDLRPEICREFERGSVDCLNHRRRVANEEASRTCF